MIGRSTARANLAIGLVLATISAVSGQQTSGVNHKAAPSQAAPPSVSPGITPPAGYIIGAHDVLSIFFLRDKEMNADVTVRPDGKISLPLINEIEAAGLTPEQLRLAISEATSRYLEDPTVSVIVKEIKSRNVFITGSVPKPGTYALVGEMNVLQLIALAGGLHEWADSKNIVVIQTENGRPKYRKFNYTEVIKQKNLEQNVILKPNDTVVVQ